jgi:hypothetical protein
VLFEVVNFLRTGFAGMLINTVSPVSLPQLDQVHLITIQCLDYHRALESPVIIGADRFMLAICDVGWKTLSGLLSHEVTV